MYGSFLSENIRQQTKLARNDDLAELGKGIYKVEIINWDFVTTHSGKKTVEQVYKIQ